MQRNLLKNPSLMSHLLTSSLSLCLFSAESLVPAPLCDVLDTLAIPIMECLSFHPHSRWKLYQMVSLSTFSHLHLCVSPSVPPSCLCSHFHLSLFHLVILVPAGAPKTSDSSSLLYTFLPCLSYISCHVDHLLQDTSTHTHSHIIWPNSGHICELCVRMIKQ